MDFSEENLISKKQLLEKYSISYGALYRWKRKGLIPEDWFIKKSTTTGQETFFPKDLITERVEMIIAKKEDVLLDELAEKISGEEENNANDLITKMELFGSDPKSLYMLNQELAARIYNAPSLVL